MDLALAHFLNQLGRGTIDGFTDVFCQVSLLVALWIALVVMVLRFDRRDGRRVALAVLLAVGLHFLISEALLKHLVLAELPMRVRPYLAHPDEIVPVGHRFTDSSFPSSHAASTAAIVTVLGASYRRFVAAPVLAALFVLLMCFSRVHNGMHYPSDVLSGSLLGLAYGALAIRGAAEIMKARARRTSASAGSSVSVTPGIIPDAASVAPDAASVASVAASVD
jgi:undecaprenyl-diphosphatase